MRIESSFPTPIYGISTLAPRTRPNGYASKQINFRSDPVNKLSRRPSSLWENLEGVIEDPDQVQVHSYERGGNEYYFIVDKVTNIMRCYENNNITDTIDLGDYGLGELGFYTVEHDTYILNKDMVVEQLPDVDGVTERVSYVNITSALNYSETIRLFITTSDGVRHTVEYTVPELGQDNPNYDEADKARATTAVASQLALKINDGTDAEVQIINPDYDGDVSVCHTPYIYEHEGGGVYSRRDNPDYNPEDTRCKPYLTEENPIAGVTAVHLGSTVAMWENSTNEWLHVEIETGQGDRSARAFNETVEDTNGIPLYAVVGSRIKVRPDPTSEDGVYYLQAERIADESSGERLEEVVWSETRSPYQPYALDNGTMPHRVRWDGASFSYDRVNFKERQVGDDDTVPFPDFLGQKISTMSYFQNRLVIVAENAVYMSETDDSRNFFKQSAVKLLVSDTIGISTSDLGSDKILHLVPHNRDLLCITSNSQFKISGREAITPETVSMPLTTKYECQVSVAPVAIGNSVYFPIDYGDSTGVQEYSGERETSQDFATPITHHIIGYIKGQAELFTASPNLEMLAMTASETAKNTVYIYEQYTDPSGKRTQQSWSEWQFTEDDHIVDIKFRRNKLVLIVVTADKHLAYKYVPMYTRVASGSLEVYLDDMYIATSVDGNSCPVHPAYQIDGCIAVRGEGAEDELWQVQFTVNGDELVFNENIGEGAKVYIGRKFTSAYQPTRPFKYDDDGSTITTDKIRVGKYILSLVDTYKLTMLKESSYNDSVEVEFESRFVNQYAVGSLTAYTGDWKFSFNEDAAYATATFYTDTYLGCTVSDISWEGQYFQSKGRM